MAASFPSVPDNTPRTPHVENLRTRILTIIPTPFQTPRTTGIFSVLSGWFLRWPQIGPRRYSAPIFPVFPPATDRLGPFDRSRESPVGATAPVCGAQTKR